MTIIDDTQTGFQLAGARDAGGHGKMSAQDMKDALDHVDIYALLAEKYPGEIDLGRTRSDAQREIEEQWLDLSLAVSERRKFGVEKDGLCH
jgi:hypothetical protein